MDAEDPTDEQSSEIDRMCDVPGVRCTVCNRVFCTVSYLRRHVRMHTGVRPFQCAVCDKAFPGSFSKSVDFENMDW